jgi:hypothetical protein
MENLGGEGPPLFTPNEELVTTLMSLSFTRNAAIKVCIYIFTCIHLYGHRLMLAAVEVGSLTVIDAFSLRYCVCNE